MGRFPDNLIAFQRMFPDAAACAAWLASVRWPDAFECPGCGHDRCWALRGKAMFQMCGVFTEFERAMIQERVKAGLARAKAQGKTLGRPKVNGKIEKAVLAARAKGTGKRKISKQLSIGVSTVNRILSEAA